MQTKESVAANPALNARDFGFSPSASADGNSEALNRAVRNGGVIEVTEPGVYDVSEPVYLGSDTSLRFAPGVTLRRQPCENGDNGNVFVNRGAFTGVPDKNIEISGLTLLVNGVESLPAQNGGTKTVILTVGLSALAALLFPLKDEAGTPEAPEAREKEAEA